MDLNTLEKMIIETIEKLRLASQNMPKVWDGRESILEMKSANFRYWRQMEWIDFYFKFLCQTHFTGIIDMPGKKYGNTAFDAFRKISWDFKTDSVDPRAYSVTANDAKGIADTISDYGYYGIIIAIGDMEWDDKETSLKKWHDEIRGKVSKYDTNKINSGIMARTRKRVFTLKDIHFICFNSETLHQCSGLFQEGFGETDRNRPKRKDIRMDISEIPDVAFVTTEVFRE